MATLTDEPYPMPDWDDYDDIDAHIQAQEEALGEIDDVVRFPRADGYAIYRVVELDGPDGEPLLQHVPFGDAYRLPAAHVRGLRKEDIEQKWEQREKLRNLTE